MIFCSVIKYLVLQMFICPQSLIHIHHFLLPSHVIKKKMGNQILYFTFSLASLLLLLNYLSLFYQFCYLAMVTIIIIIMKRTITINCYHQIIKIININLILNVIIIIIMRTIIIAIIFAFHLICFLSFLDLFLFSFEVLVLGDRSCLLIG